MAGILALLGIYFWRAHSSLENKDISFSEFISEEIQNSREKEVIKMIAGKKAGQSFPRGPVSRNEAEVIAKGFIQGAEYPNNKMAVFDREPVKDAEIERIESKEMEWYFFPSIGEVWPTTLAPPPRKANDAEPRKVFEISIFTTTKIKIFKIYIDSVTGEVVYWTREK